MVKSQENKQILCAFVKIGKTRNRNISFYQFLMFDLETVPGSLSGSHGEDTLAETIAAPFLFLWAKPKASVHHVMLCCSFFQTPDIPITFPFSMASEIMHLAFYFVSLFRSK